MSSERYGRCLETLVEEQAGRGGRALLITPVSWVDFLPEHEGESDSLIAAYRAVISEVARDTRALHLNLATAPWTRLGSPDLLMRDPVHPSVRGHDRIAWQIRRLLVRSGHLPEGARREESDSQAPHRAAE